MVVVAVVVVVAVAAAAAAMTTMISDKCSPKPLDGVKWQRMHVKTVCSGTYYTFSVFLQLATPLFEYDTTEN
jgi:hypothetical protein